MQKAALYTSSVIFAAGAVFHIVRLIAGYEIFVGGVGVPLWASLPGALASALLAVWMVLAARRP